MRTLRWIAVAALVSAVAAHAGVAARAGDPLPAPGVAEVRVYSLGALLRTHPWFFADRGPGADPLEDINDKDEPLYGDEPDESHAPLGRMEDLVEALRAASGGPGEWESGSVEVLGVGGNALFVRASRQVHDAIDVRLAEWAGEVCTSVVVDVALLEGDVSAARGRDGLRAAVASGALRPLGIARVLPPTSGAGTARDGARFAYLQDHDTEIGCSCNVTNPILGVVAQGLAVQVVALPAAAGRWFVRVKGFWADAPDFAERRMQGGRFFLPHVVGPRVPVPPGGDRFEMVSIRGEPFEVPLTLEEGAWEPVALSGRRVMAVRVRVERPDLGKDIGQTGGRLPVAGEPFEPRAASAVARALSWHSFWIGDLLQPIESASGTSFRIFPSNYYSPRETPPEPQLRPTVTVEALQWILERTGASARVDGGDTGLRVRPQRLAMRADAARAAAVEQVLSDLRARRGHTTEVEVHVVTLPLASLPEVWSDPDAVVAGGVGAMLARPGARLVETARLLLRDGQRQAVVSGKSRSYLMDYDPELACTTTIGNPVVAWIPTGVSVDVQADPVLSSPLVSFLVRIDRGVLLGMRDVSTRFGDIQAPTMQELSLRGAVTLAPGETHLFGLSASGPEATLVLLSVRR